MKMESYELDELLKGVRTQGSTFNTRRALNGEERAAIIVAILPDINSRIERATLGSQAEKKASGISGFPNSLTGAPGERAE